MDSNLDVVAIVSTVSMCIGHSVQHGRLESRGHGALFTALGHLFNWCDLGGHMGMRKITKTVVHEGLTYTLTKSGRVTRVTDPDGKVLPDGALRTRLVRESRISGRRAHDQCVSLWVDNRHLSVIDQISPGNVGEGVRQLMELGIDALRMRKILKNELAV